MTSFKKALIYGVVIWAIGMAIAVAIFGIRETNRPLFESIMPVGISVAMVIFGYLYFKGVKNDFVSEGIKLGLVWLGINLALDAVAFSYGPMAMSVADYISDIGVTYLMMPVITVGMGKLLESKK